jgi:peptidoglycan/LPS O-acetylase OafA/YrhL
MNRLTPAQSILLDALRGLSALAVLLGHSLSSLPKPPAIGTTYPIQSYGVIVFFALSGFLIAYSCLVKDNYSFTEYMIDRFARIYTCFLPALLVVAAVDVLVLDHFRSFGATISGNTFFANLFMLQRTHFDRMIDGFPYFHVFGSARQFWTIPVEWWLYVLFGIIFFARRSSPAERIAIAMLLIPAAFVVFYFCTHETIGLVWVFCAIGAVAFCHIIPSAKITGLSLIAVIFFVIALTMRLQLVNAEVSFDLTFMMLIVGLFLSLLALAAENPAFVASLNWSRHLWAWLSSISYSLYLTHLTLRYAYSDFFGIANWRDIVLLCLMSVALGWLFTYLFDRHHKLVARWLKSRCMHSPTPPGKAAPVLMSPAE